MESTAPEPPSLAELNARLLASVEAAKRWDDEDIARWRNATMEERAEEISQLLRMWAPPRTGPVEPLRYPRLPMVSKKGAWPNST